MRLTIEPRDDGERRRGARLPRPVRWLLAGIALLCVYFLGVRIAARATAGDIAGEADEISTNGAPSVVLLTNALSELQQMVPSATTCVAPSAEHERREIAQCRAEDERLRRSLSATLAAYARLPSYPGERAFVPAVRFDVDALQAEVQRMLTLEEEGDSTAAIASRARALELADRADTSVRALIDFNLSEVRTGSRRIVALREKATHLLNVLDLVGVGLGVLLALVAARASLQLVRLNQERDRLADDRARELGAFAARVAHDLKNPLGTLGLRVAALQRRHAPGELDEPLAAMARSVRQLASMIDGLLAFATAGGQPEPGAQADVRLVLGDVVDAARARDAEVELDLDVPSELPPVACTNGALASVLSNLIGNAMKYVRAVDGPRRVVVRAESRGRRVRVEVADTGPGLPADVRETLFEPFVRGAATRALPGVGLGLATVKRVVEGFGGQVDAYANEWKGATFWFELPAAEPEPIGSATPSMA